MRFPWERDRRRTCDNCGETWVVPYLLRRQKPENWRKAAREAARRPRADTVTGARTRSNSAAGGGAEAAKAWSRRLVDPWREQSAALGLGSPRAEAAEAERKLIASLARCPACLSTDYTDTPIR